MKIFIDLSYIYSLNSGGKTQFSFILLKGILKTDTKNDYTIICNNSLIDLIKRTFPTFKTIVIKDYHKFKNNKIVYLFMELVYKNFIIPHIIKNQYPDVVFFPTNVYVFSIGTRKSKQLCFRMIYSTFQIQ